MPDPLFVVAPESVKPKSGPASDLLRLSIKLDTFGTQLEELFEATQGLRTAHDPGSAVAPHLHQAIDELYKASRAAEKLSLAIHSVKREDATP